ncbi:MAG: hypothetical protein IJP03_05545, partial [Christensenellaceae bacterium]|nr:hypothetical protein [Christensenellaceae bacterium]
IADAIRQVVAATAHDPVTAVSVSSMTDTFTPFGADGRPLQHSIMSYDARAAKEVAEIAEAFDDPALYDITGMPLHPMHPAFKIRWLQKNRPQVAEKVWKYLSYEEMILWRLGAEPASSYSSSGRTFLFDNNTKDWNKDLLEYFHVDAASLPALCPSGVEIGRVSKAAAQATGLPEGAKLISGGFDQACCATACGVFQKGELADTTGTNEIIYFIVEPKAKAQLLANKFSYSYHIFGDTFSTFAHMFNAGGALKWYRNNFFSTKNVPYDDITAAMPEDVTDVFFLPFLAGMGTPEMDPMQKSSFFGLSLASDKHVIAKAILEGVTMESRYNLALAESMGAAGSDTVKALGGATKSPVWMQLKADICGKAFECYPDLEAGAAGAAILAGSGSGVFGSPRDGYLAIRSATAAKNYQPQPQKVKEYDEKYAKYVSLREVIKHV